jgi:UDP-glucose 4-epimerase
MAEARQRLLLLGGTGFIGTNLSQVLATAGHDVLVAGHKVEAAQLPAGVQPVSLPLGAVEELVASIERERIGTVVHLVSALKPSSTLADYLAERDAVLTPTLRLASALAELGTRLVYFSSGGTIYGAASGDHAEDDPCEPISFYGQSKLEVETHLRFLQRSRGLRLLIVRPSNPYGPHQALNGGQGLISVLFGRISEKSALEVWGDGSSTRDYLYIDDLVATVCALIERGVEGTTLNIGSGEGHSLLDVVRIVEQVTGRRVPLDFRPARTGDVPRLVLDVSRLRGMGLHRSRPLVEGIRTYAATLGLVSG